MNPRRIDENHSFNIHLAAKVGIEKAILLKELYGWCHMNLQNKRNIHYGTAWTYNSSKALGEKFNYMNERSIRRWMEELQKDGWILISNFNKRTFDKTNWYTIFFEKYESVILGNEVSKQGETWWNSIKAAIGQNDQRSDKLANDRTECPAIGQDVQTIPSPNNISYHHLYSFSNEKEPFQNPDEISPKNQPETKEEVPAVDVVTPIEEEQPEPLKQTKAKAPRKPKQPKEEKAPAIGTLAIQVFNEWYERETGDEFTWTQKDAVNTHTLIKKIKEKVDAAIKKGRTDVIYETDAELIDLAFMPFLQKYGKLKTWYSDSKTPSNMIARFNDIWKDIKTIDCNGKSTKLTGARAAIAELLQNRYAKAV